METIAKKSGVNFDMGKRLVRAMYALRVLNETSDGKYSLTPCGEIFTSSHPTSLKNGMLLVVGSREIFDAY